MTAREDLVRAGGEAILAEARKWPELPDRYGARVAPMGATGDDLGRAVLAVVDAAGWRPPLPKQDARLLRSLVAGVIDGHFGDDYREQAEAAAQELIDRGWLDKTGAVGQPEPVATTLRRIIRDLEDQAAGPQRHTHAGIALSQYADRLRGHPALGGDADAGWPPLPDTPVRREVGPWTEVQP